jgi:hypothetical protein
MRLLLGTTAAVLALTLAGCADDGSDTASDPSGQESSTAGPTPTEPTPTEPTPTETVDSQTIAIVSETAAGGAVDLHAVPVGDAAARQEFTAQFERGSLDQKIADAVAAATIPEGYTVMAAVVAIGCDVPPDVTVTHEDGVWVLTPHKVPSPLQECFAAVTSVAVVAVPA